MRGRRTLVLATLIPGHGQARPGHLGSAEADRDCDLGAGEVSRTRTQAGAVPLTGSPGHNLNSSHHHRPPSRRLSHRASALEYRVPPARRRPVTGGHGHWPGPGPCGPGQTEAGLWTPSRKAVLPPCLCAAQAGAGESDNGTALSESRVTAVRRRFGTRRARESESAAGAESLALPVPGGTESDPAGPSEPGYRDRSTS